MQSAHRRAVAATCREHARILCVQDTSELDFTDRQATGLGKIGDGHGQGVVGILHQDLHCRHERRAGETLRERQARWTEAMVWADTARAVDRLDLGETQIAQVGDRGADRFDFFALLPAARARARRAGDV